MIHPDESTIDDKEVVQDCAIRLAESKLLQVVLHEMGHGFGLRHVFSASADVDNFYQNDRQIDDLFSKKYTGWDLITDSINLADLSHNNLTVEDLLIEDGKQYQNPAKYSSVMDYTAHQYPKLTVPGLYDVAAIRFIYFDEVELTDEKGLITGETLKIPYLSGGEKNKKVLLIMLKNKVSWRD